MVCAVIYGFSSFIWWECLIQQVTTVKDIFTFKDTDKVCARINTFDTSLYLSFRTKSQHVDITILYSNCNPLVHKRVLKSQKRALYPIYFIFQNLGIFRFIGIIVPMILSQHIWKPSWGILTFRLITWMQVLTFLYPSIVILVVSLLTLEMMFRCH